MPTFGRTAAGESSSAGHVGYVDACKFTLSEIGIAKSVSVYLVAAAGNVRLAVYVDSAGTPGALQAQTASVAAAVGWNTLNLTTTPTLAAGAYWLADQFDNDTSERQYADAGAANQFCYRPLDYAAFPNPFGTVEGFRADEVCVYCTYDLPLGGFAWVF